MRISVPFGTRNHCHLFTATKFECLNNASAKYKKPLQNHVIITKVFINHIYWKMEITLSIHESYKYGNVHVRSMKDSCVGLTTLQLQLGLY